MKGEIFERAKHIVLNIIEYIIKIAWEVIIIDEIAMETAWEAFHLFGLYITLRIVKQMLLIAEYMPLEVKTSLIEPVEEKVGLEMKQIGNLFEKGESQLWQILRLYHVLQAEISMLKSRMMDSKNDVLLYDNLNIESDCRSVHIPVPHITEALTYSYYC